MSFRSPLLLVLLAVPVAALVGYVLVQRRPARSAIRFTNLAVLASVAPPRPRWRHHLPAALLLGALVALVIGIARPTVVAASAESGSTAILVVDVSGSMRATDVEPSRLEAARAAMLRFMDKAPKGLRVGVVAFSSEPSVIAAPTADHELVREGIEQITIGSRTAIGDAIARAVELAHSAVAPAEAETGGDGASDTPAQAAIVLLSDGAQTAGLLSPDDGAVRAKAAQVPVSTVALGTPEGTLDRGSFGRGGGFGPGGGGFGPGGGGPGGGGGSFNQGRIPVPPDPVTLARIAETTGGTAFTAETSSRLNSIYGKLGSSVKRIERPREITFALVAAGTVLLLGAAGLAVLTAPRLP